MISDKEYMLVIDSYSDAGVGNIGGVALSIHGTVEEALESASKEVQADHYKIVNRTTDELVLSGTIEDLIKERG